MDGNWFVGVPIHEATWFDARFDPPAPDLWRVNPHDLHMTVAFLGPVRERQARDAFTRASLWTRGSFSVSLGEIIALGNPRKYSALCALFSEGNARAIQFIETLRTPMLEAARVAPDSRDILPHITVMRPKRRAPRPQRQAGLEWARSLSLVDESILIDKLALYTWREDRSVRRYQKMDLIEL